MNPPGERHLERVPRLGRAADVELGAREQVEGAQQVLARKPRGQRREPVALVLGGNFRIRQARRVDTDDHQVPREARQLPADEPQVVPGLDDRGGLIEGAGHVLVGHGLDDRELPVAADEPEDGADVGGRDLVGRERQDLIERRQRVAHAAFGRPRHQRNRGVVDRHLLGFRDAAELIPDGRERQRLQLEDLRARADGVRHLVQLGRRHHELDVGRRLLDGLQQRVERVLRDAMDFVDDENLESIAHRRDGERLDDHLADVVDAGVGGAVDLEDVHVAALRDLHARVARAAGLGRRALHAVERAREDARGRRLPDAARAREDEGLREPPARHRVLQREDGPALADDVIEALRTPFSGQSQVRHEQR